METKGSAPQIDDWGKKIARYYDETWLDYRAVWLNRGNLAMHMGYYDENTKSHAQSLVNTVRVMADRVGIGAGDRVFDAGCGVGGPAFWLAKERGAQVVGVTLSSAQVERATRYARDRGLDSQVEFHQRDFRDTGFPAESFDVVFACESVGHTRDQREFFAEAHRLLRPGGRLIIRDGYKKRDPVNDEERRLIDQWFDAWVVPELPTIGQAISWIEETGFEQVAAEDISANVIPSGKRLYFMCRVCEPLSAVLTKVRVRTPIQHSNLTGSIAGWRGHLKGLWQGCHVRARKPQANN